MIIRPLYFLYLSTLKKRKQRLEKEEELRSKERKKSLKQRRVSVTTVEEANSSPEVSIASGNPSGAVLESQESPERASDSGSNSEPEKDIGSSESLDWDAKGDIESPLKDEEEGCIVESLPPALSRFRSASTSVNRVN